METLESPIALVLAAGLLWLGLIVYGIVRFFA